MNNDKLFVELFCPKISEEEILFIFPKVIPGTYNIDNFGRFIFNFKAFDQANNLLKVEKHDVNCFKIYNSNKIYKITYEVADTWDENPDSKDFVFQPSGTNFSGKDNFVLNNHALFGYFENYQNTEYHIIFTRPEDFYPTTSMNLLNSNASIDEFTAKNYANLIDNPILYCKPDTISYFVGQTKITISVYSDSKKVSAKMLVDKIKRITKTVSNIFGILPVSEYKFIYYFFNGNNSKQKQISYGALEHKNCSFYYIYSGLGRNIDSVQLYKDVVEMSSHEFMHIFSPILLRSSEIANFDYYHPIMSRHLWFYEGVTEYLATKILLKSGLINMDEFIGILRDKIISAEKYKNTSLITLSQKILEPNFQNQFSNIYDKGALIAFIMDIELSKCTNKKLGLVGLYKNLLTKYNDTPFDENNFIDEIVYQTNSEIDSIFEKYIKGTKHIEFNRYLQEAGLHYFAQKETDTYSFGKLKVIKYLSLSEPEKNRYLIKPFKSSKFGKNNFFLLKINEKKITEELLHKFLLNPENKDEVSFEIEINGSLKILKLRPEEIKKMKNHILELNDNKSESQHNIFNMIFT